MTQMPLDTVAQNDRFDGVTAAGPNETGGRAKPYRICLMHPFDPRGEKVGGLETYIRDFITFSPDDIDVLFIGVDSRGDLPLGKVHRIAFRGRSFDFLPILRYNDERAREAARSIRESITAQFFAAIARHFIAIARAIRARRCSIDLRRVEFAWVPFVLHTPYIQMLHGEGAPRLPMDSLLRKYRFVHGAGERFAMMTCRKFLCVNPFITERLQATYPAYKDKIDTLWTWVNTNIFRPQALPPASGPFKIVFAGRLDEFKVPPLMFRTIARLRELLRGQVEFHYVGTSDPHRFAEFAAIEGVTVRHGFKDAAGMANVIAGVHAGILTSEFEGMPRFVLETLAIGRPVVAVHLPQLEVVIRDGASGYLVSREQPEQTIVEELARRFVEVRDALAGQRLDPFAIAQQIESFTPRTQLARVYQFHREIQGRGIAALPATVHSVGR